MTWRTTQFLTFEPKPGTLIICHDNSCFWLVLTKRHKLVIENDPSKLVHIEIGSNRFSISHKFIWA